MALGDYQTNWCNASATDDNCGIAPQYYHNAYATYVTNNALQYYTTDVNITTPLTQYITVGSVANTSLNDIKYYQGYDYFLPDMHTATGAASIQWLPPTARELKLEKLKNQLKDHTVYKRVGAGKADTKAEERSRESLKAIIGPDRYRKYLRDGFVMIRSPNGKLYQVFPGHKMTEFKDGKTTKERLCVVFKDQNLPPTDVLIMRVMMLLGDEEGFRKIAHIHAVAEQQPAQQPAWVFQPTAVEAA